VTEQPLPLKIWTEKGSHFLNEIYNAFVSYLVVDEVCIFTVVYYPLAAEYIQVLGYVGISSLDLIPYLPHRELLVLEET